ncbi:hypothetical protein D3C75_1236020 [compost metagenome]
MRPERLHKHNGKLGACYGSVRLERAVGIPADDSQFNRLFNIGLRPVCRQVTEAGRRLRSRRGYRLAGAVPRFDCFVLWRRRQIFTGGIPV